MKEISNLKEKSILIARQLIIKQIEPTDENIILAWCGLFPDDKPKLNDVELFEWMRKFINSNGIKSCNEKLLRIRKNGERNLKNKGISVGYGAKLVEQPKDRLATYNIFTKGKKYSGNYSSLSRRMGQFPKKKRGRIADAIQRIGMERHYFRRIS